jgi:hypothetical protein
MYKVLELSPDFKVILKYLVITRQTYNVILRGVSATSVAVEKQ